MEDLFREKPSSFNARLHKGRIEILQVNVGKLCNLACVHCHVEAGPAKMRENMDQKTAEAVIRFLDRFKIKTLDITGGAPEMNPRFRFLVTEARKRNVHVIDRCNLTVLFLEGQENLAEFLASNQVELIASLPCYLRENVDKQRGKGTFDESIEALKLLNCLGYGEKDSGLVLNLVYNPVGPHLPPCQAELEKDYKERLSRDFGIIFNQLYAITNMPITRYEKYLRALNQYDSYIELLNQSFNPVTLEGLMCKNTLSIGWDGRIYDCDFNQALDMEMRNGKPFTIFDLNLKNLEGTEILTGNHCFGCTAGAGSSCQGALQ
ncbi:MAG: arsenosugar biosynthesis radical SAM protein ArsS [Candidatus Omnitrophica bacterium]|nr:arsenosugar biosynthesis radical SAM protein ArsS [Candidatus Omnitrophota bacterium]